jgi:hypothetical protein
VIGEKLFSFFLNASSDRNPNYFLRTAREHGLNRVRGRRLLLEQEALSGKVFLFYEINKGFQAIAAANKISFLWLGHGSPIALSSNSERGYSEK